MRKLFLSCVAPAALLALTLSAQPSNAMVRAAGLHSALGIGQIVRIADEKDDDKPGDRNKANDQSKPVDNQSATTEQKPKKKKARRSSRRTKKDRVMKDIKRYVPKEYQGYIQGSGGGAGGAGGAGGGQGIPGGYNQ